MKRLFVPLIVLFSGPVCAEPITLSCEYTTDTKSTAVKGEFVIDVEAKTIMMGQIGTFQIDSVDKNLIRATLHKESKPEGLFVIDRKTGSFKYAGFDLTSLKPTIRVFAGKCYKPLNL